MNQCIKSGPKRTAEMNRKLAAIMGVCLKNPIPLYCKRLIDGAVSGKLTSNDTGPFMQTGIPNAKIVEVIRGN
jgi:hypothetical protein